MKFPSNIYVIYPLDENGKIAGAYVGMSHQVDQRMFNHLANGRAKEQGELHDLMRKNGFCFQVLDEVKSFDDTHLEADWISFFDFFGVRTFNISKKKGSVINGICIKGGNYLNLVRGANRSFTRIVEPTWAGAGVLWRTVTLETS